MEMDEDRFYDAIREGVEDAMWRLMNNATDMPCADFYASIKDGVEEAHLKLSDY